MPASDWRDEAEVPVGPLQARFRELEAQGITAIDIARRLGWYERRADKTRVLRALGIRSYQSNGKKERRWRRTIKPKTARALADAMDCDLDI